MQKQKMLIRSSSDNIREIYRPIHNYKKEKQQPGMERKERCMEEVLGKKDKFEGGVVLR